MMRQEDGREKEGRIRNEKLHQLSINTRCVANYASVRLVR